MWRKETGREMSTPDPMTMGKGFIKFFIFGLGLGLLIGLLSGPLTGLAWPQAAVGDTPTYAFRTPPLGSLGLTDLAELQGKPLLVEFWGTR